MFEGSDAGSGATCIYLKYELHQFFNTLNKMVTLTRSQSPPVAIGMTNAPVAQTEMVLDIGKRLRRTFDHSRLSLKAIRQCGGKHGSEYGTEFHRKGWQHGGSIRQAHPTQQIHDDLRIPPQLQLHCLPILENGGNNESINDNSAYTKAHENAISAVNILLRLM